MLKRGQKWNLNELSDWICDLFLVLCRSSWSLWRGLEIRYRFGSLGAQTLNAAVFQWVLISFLGEFILLGL